MAAAVSVIVFAVSLVQSTSGYECSLGSRTTIQLDVGDQGFVYASSPKHRDSLHSQCEVSFEACAGCRVLLHLQEFRLQSCAYRTPTRPELTSCDPTARCEYLSLLEPGASPYYLIGNRTVSSYRSSTPALTLRLCFLRSRTYTATSAWKVSFFVIDTYTARFRGSSHEHQKSKGILRSPGFPYGYACNKTSFYTFLIQSTDRRDQILIIFDDFDISPRDSVVTIYDGANHTHRGLSYHRYNDRPVYLSSGPALLVEFAPGHCEGQRGRHIGFKATYRFLSDMSSWKRRSIQKDCGSVRARTGGVLSLRLPSAGPRFYDCAWSLPAPSGLQMALKVISFNISTALPNTRLLTVHSAPHSDGPLVATLTSERLPFLPPEGFTSAEGFYLRLQAEVHPQEHLLFSYAPYKPINSLSVPSTDCGLFDIGVLPRGFACDVTRRCIPDSLKCDGIDHCGSQEDEQLNVCAPPPREALDTTSLRVTCHPPMVRCSNNLCVSHGALCPPREGSRNILQCTISRPYPCRTGGGCYTHEEKCNGINQCPDMTDELDCQITLINKVTGHASVGTTLATTWFFFLPLLLLLCALTIGYVVYRARKIVADPRYFVAPPDGRHCHRVTLTSPAPAPSSGSPPPPYDLIMTSDLLILPNERELPPAYDEFPFTPTFNAPPYLSRDVRAPSYETLERSSATFPLDGVSVDPSSSQSYVTVESDDDDVEVCTLNRQGQEVGDRNVDNIRCMRFVSEGDLQTLEQTAQARAGSRGSLCSTRPPSRHSLTLSRKRRHPKQLLQSMRRRSPTPVSHSPTESWVNPMTETSQVALRQFDSLDDLTSPAHRSRSPYSVRRLPVDAEDQNGNRACAEQCPPPRDTTVNIPVACLRCILDSNDVTTTCGVTEPVYQNAAVARAMELIPRMQYGMYASATDSMANQIGGNRNVSTRESAMFRSVGAYSSAAKLSPNNLDDNKVSTQTFIH